MIRGLVEMRGVEPRSETASRQATTCLSGLWISPWVAPTGRQPTTRQTKVSRIRACQPSTPVCLRVIPESRTDKQTREGQLAAVRRPASRLCYLQLHLIQQLFYESPRSNSACNLQLRVSRRNQNIPSRAGIARNVHCSIYKYTQIPAICCMPRHSSIYMWIWPAETTSSYQPPPFAAGARGWYRAIYLRQGQGGGTGRTLAVARGEGGCYNCKTIGKK